VSPDPTPEWVRARRREIGQQLRQARIQAGLTQEGLDGRSGIDRQAINRIEQGHAAPRLDTLIRLAAAIGVPLAHLVREEEPRPAPTGDTDRPGPRAPRSAP
jgi:transcriptional regulator with XRE-family HTH domain